MKPFWMAVTVITVSLISCKKDKNNSLSVDKTEVLISGIANIETSLQITTPGTWKLTVEGSADWLQIEPTSGQGDATVQLKNKVNNYTDLAEVNLTLTGEGGAPVTIKLTRKPLFHQPTVKTLGGSDTDQFNGGVATADGGFILVGTTESADQDFPSDQMAEEDGVAVKYSAAGTIEWKKFYGGNDVDILSSVIVTDDGGYLMVGSSSSNDGDLSNQHGQDDYWVIKTDKNGNKQWSKLYGSDGDNNAYGCIAVNGGYIIGGISKEQNGDVSQSFGNTDAWIIRLSNSGVLEWEKSFGGPAFEGVRSLIRTPDGSCILAGFYESAAGAGAEGAQGSLDGWIMKFNATNGEKIWSKRYGGTQLDVLYSIFATEKGELIASGTSLSNDGQLSGNHGKEDALIVKTTTDGQLQWAKLTGGTGNDRAHAVVYYADKGIVAAGYTESPELQGHHGAQDGMLSWLNNDGIVANIKSIGGTGTDVATLLLKTARNHYVTGGYHGSESGDFPTNRGSYDCWLIGFE